MISYGMCVPVAVRLVLPYTVLPFRLDVGPLNPAKGSRSAVSSSSGVWTEPGPAEIEFGAF